MKSDRSEAGQVYRPKKLIEVALPLDAINFASEPGEGLGSRSEVDRFRVEAGHRALVERLAPGERCISEMRASSARRLVEPTRTYEHDATRSIGERRCPSEEIRPGTRLSLELQGLAFRTAEGVQEIND